MVFNSKKDLNLYFEKNGFSKKRRDIYLGAYDKGINIYPYLNTEIRTGRLKQILLGLRQGIDVSIYDDYNVFRQDQMKQIRHGLLKGLDVSIYAKPEFTDKQMEVIRTGMEEGLDVSLYADPRISSRQMTQFKRRMLAQQEREIVTLTNPNASRFNLEEFKFQRVAFEGTITEFKMATPYKYSLLVKNLFWQDYYICDHIWIGEIERVSKKFMYMEKFNFGDMISFSAEVEPYLHNKDAKIHYGLRNIKDIQILNKAEYIYGYPLYHILRFNLKAIKYYNEDTKQICEGYNDFLSEHGLEGVEQVELKLIGYKNLALVFEIIIEGITLSEVYGVYSPCGTRGKIQIKTFFFELTDLYSRKERKLINTFFQAKFLSMFPMLEMEK